MPFTALMYHSLSDGDHPDEHAPKYSIKLATFRDHLVALMDQGFHLCSFSDLEKLLSAGITPKERTCALTFDDGHRSSLDLSEVMKSLNLTGTFFLTVNYCRNRNDFLRPEDICLLAREGFDFGTHGVTHRPLSSLPRSEMIAELSDSKAWLESILRRRVGSMSLPAGQGGRTVCRTAFRFGYSLVGTSREGANPDRLCVPCTIRRMVVRSGHTAKDVVRIARAPGTYVFGRRVRATAIWLPKKILKASYRTRQ